MSTADRILNFRSTLDDSQFLAAIDRMEVNVGSMTDQIINQNGELESFGKKAADLTNKIFSLENMAEFVKAMVQVRNEYQQLELSFSTILKNKAAADDLMGGLSSFAGKTPFSLKESGDAAKQLLSYGSTTKDVVAELKTLGEVATGASVPIADLAAVYGNMKKGGTASESDISQLASKGIPIYEELAKVMGVGKERISGLVAAGQVGFPQVEQAFENLTAAGGTFYGAMEAQSGTLGGQLETLSGAWDAMLNSLGQDGEGFFSGAISTAISLVENYEKVLDGLVALIAVYGVYRAAMILTSLIQLTTAEVTAGVTVAFKLQYYWTGMLTAVQRVLNATMLANPFVLTAVAIAGLIAVMYTLHDSASAYEKAQTRLNAASEKAAQDADNLKSKVGGLNSVLQDQNATEFQQAEAYKKLQALYPDRLKNLTKEAYLKMGVADAQKMLNAENDKNSVAATGKGYDEAKKKISGLSDALKRYEDMLANPSYGDKSGIVTLISQTREELEIANWEAKELGSKFEEQQEALKVSLMTESQKLEYYEQQKNKLIDQRDLLLEMTGGSREMKAQLTDDPFFPLNGHLTEASDKITDIFNISEKLGLSFGKYSLFSINKQLGDTKDMINGLTEKKVVPETLKDIDKKIQDQRDLLPGVSNNKGHRVIEAKIGALEKRRAKITGEKTGGKVDTKEDKENRSAAIDSQIAAFSDKFNSTLSDDQKKLKAIQKEYDALNKALIAYNKNPDNVKKKIDLKPAFDLAKKNQEYANETEQIKEQLEEQKSLYAAYEVYKSLVGKDAAAKEFAGLLKNGANYEALLQSYIDKIKETPADALSSQQRDRLKEMSSDLEAYRAEQKAKDAASFEQAYNASKTFAQKEQDARNEYQAQLDALKKDKNGGVDAEQLKNLENIRDASINATREEAFQKGEIYKKLSEDALILTREQIKKQIVIMRSLLDDPNISPTVKADVETKLDGLKGRLKLGADKSNLKELEEKKDGINKNLNHRLNKDKTLKDPNNDAEVKRLEGELAEVQSKINDINTTGLKGFMNSLKDNKALQGLSTGLSLASDAASTMSQALGGVDTEAGYTMDTIGQLAGAAADVAGSIVSGDPAKMVGSAIKAVGTLFSIGKRVREMNEKAKKEVADFYSNAIKGEREYQDSLKERALQRVRDNKTALNGIKDELKIRQDQMAGWKQESEEIMGKLSGMSSIASETYKHGTWFRKAKVVKTYESLEGKNYGQLSQLLSEGKLEGDAKALVERLKELEQKGFDAEKAIADLAKQTNEIFTGTNSDNLTNSLLGMFKDGKTGAQDLADFFKQTMDDAALSIFKNKILAGAMENFYKEFAQRGVSGEELTDTEISELEGIFNNSMANAAKEYEALKKITGRDPSNAGAGPSGLTGASSIKREITEETAGVLTGLWRGQFDLTKQLVTLSMERNAVVNTVGVNAMELLNVARSNFDVALKIESNTYRTANNTDGISGKLDQIIVNTQPSMGTRSLG